SSTLSPICPTPTRSICSLSLHDALPICFFPPFGTFGDSSPAHSQLQAGSSALATAGSWMISTFASMEGMELGIAPLPEGPVGTRSEEHTSELQSRFDLVCRHLLEKKKLT